MNSACHYANTFDDELAREFKQILSSNKGMMQEEPSFSPDQVEGLVLWLDASDKSTIQLTYSSESLGGVTASGTSGTNTITTSSDVSASLAVGSRIRLGAAGAVTAADTLGADTYTITNIDGTTITVAETLTNNYSNATLYRGLISQWYNKNNIAQNAAQPIQTNMPLYSANNAYFNGSQYLDVPYDADLNGLNTTTFVVANATGGAGQYRSPLTSRSTGPTGGYLFYAANNNTWQAWIGNGAWGVVTGDNVTLGSPQILSHSIAAGNMTFYQNSQDKGSASTMNTNPSRPTRIGGGASEGGLQFGFVGDIPEVLIYNQTLSDANRQLIEQYQSAKWGITL